MPFTRDVTGYFKPIGETHTGDFAKRRVWLLRGCRVHSRAYATLLWTCFHRWNFGTCHRTLAPVTDQLVNRWHSCPFFLDLNAQNVQQGCFALTRYEQKPIPLRLRSLIFDTRYSDLASRSTTVLQKGDPPPKSKRLPDTIFCRANGQAVFTPSPWLSAFFFIRRQIHGIWRRILIYLPRLRLILPQIRSLQAPERRLHAVP